MVDLPSSSIRQWWSFKVGQEFLIKPLKPKMSYLKHDQGSQSQKRAEVLPLQSIQIIESWAPLTGSFWRCWSFSCLTNSVTLDWMPQLKLKKEKKKPKRKRNTYCSVCLSKQSHQLQTEAWKGNLYQISGIMRASPQTKPSYKCSPLSFCISHYSCCSQKSATPCLIKSADEETLLCVFAKCLHSSCPWISKSFRQLLNQSIINPVLVGRALQVFRELSWYPWGWTERKPMI